MTESVFIKDAQEINTALNKFRAAGYPVWMDDFGSGYSSLNVLKDYDFDTIKLDMAFLSSFTDRAREIIKYIIEMAKPLGIHTLAEGVETPEQYAFLRSIGCEMVQGYLFSQPLPYKQSLEHIEELGLPHETRDIRTYYSKAGSIDFLADRPLALVEYDAGMQCIHFLFANPQYRRSLASKGIYSIKQCEENLNTKDSPIIQLIASFIKKVVASEKQESMTYIKGGMFMWLRIKKIAQYGQRYLGLCTLQNITTTSDQLEQVKLTGLKEKIYDLYTTVTLLDGQKKVAEPLAFWQNDPAFSPGHCYDSEKAWHYYTDTYIAPEDRERFYAFSDYTTLPPRCQRQPNRTVTDYFRTLSSDGTYQWNFHAMIILPDSQQGFLHVAYACRGADAQRVSYLVQVYKDYFEHK